MNFDDEQIADDNSIANMKLKYASLNNFKVSALKEEKHSDFDTKSLGRHLKNADKYFLFLKDFLEGEAKNYVDELKKINNLELESLKKSYAELKDLETENPQFFERPQNVLSLNKQMAQNELEGLKQLFLLFSHEKDENLKIMLEKMIVRRIDALSLMFLNPNFR